MENCFVHTYNYEYIHMNIVRYKYDYKKTTIIILLIKLIYIKIDAITAGILLINYWEAGKNGY